MTLGKVGLDGPSAVAPVTLRWAVVGCSESDNAGIIVAKHW